MIKHPQWLCNNVATKVSVGSLNPRSYMYPFSHAGNPELIQRQNVDPVGPRISESKTASGVDTQATRCRVLNLRCVE